MSWSSIFTQENSKDRVYEQCEPPGFMFAEKSIMVRCDPNRVQRIYRKRCFTLPILFVATLIIIRSTESYAQQAAEHSLKGMRSEKVFNNPYVKQYIRDSMEVLVARAQWALDAAYMEQTYVKTHRNIPGWRGYPVKEYVYYTPPDSKTGRPKKGEVMLLMPSAEKLAYWVISACWRVAHSLDYEYTMRLLKFIRWQTGGQFAVRGVVYEAMYTPGYQEPYVFKDGVTVYVADSAYVATDATFKECTQEQLDYYLKLTDSQLKPYTGTFARISSTTREMYYNYGGREDVGESTSKESRSLNFLKVVRKLYKKAWRSKDNELIDAWCYENLVSYPYEGRED